MALFREENDRFAMRKVEKLAVVILITLLGFDVWLIKQTKK